MCLECGFYKGRMVMDMSAKKQAREERLKAKKEAIQANQGEMEPEETAAEAGESNQLEAPKVTPEADKEGK
jgi:hypothetical protein